MVSIEINGTPLDLGEDATIDIDENSPIFNSYGSQSLPLTVPATPANRRALGFPDDPMSATAPNSPRRPALVTCGAFVRRGLVNVDEASLSDGIAINIGFDCSELYEATLAMQLRDLPGLPSKSCGSVDALLKELNAMPEITFPKMITAKLEKEGKATVYEYLNHSTYGKTTQIIDNKAVEVTIPNGYAKTPCLKVWRVLELIFSAAGLEIVGSNPFQVEKGLDALVVLSNVADSVATGNMIFADYLPQCTAGEFLESLWAKFGFVYSVNSTSRTVRLRLIRDIMKAPAQLDLDAYAAGPCSVVHNPAQYVKLTLKTGFDGAAPPAERFEDFVPGLRKESFIAGNSVTQWMCSLLSSDGTPTIAFRLGLDTRDFKWYRADPETKKYAAVGSSFFNWDPQPKGLEPLELSGSDESVPQLPDGTPLYLAGLCHRHSKLNGIDTDNADKEETPLAFWLNGKPQDLGMTLFAQFGGGLFDLFWRDYDEFLRHGNRSVNLPALLPVPTLQGIDTALPLRFRNVRCLPDTMTYTLPGLPAVEADITLRTLQTAGNYDLRSEQALPPLNSVNGHYVWACFGSNFDDKAKELEAEILNWDEAKIKEVMAGDWFADYNDAAAAGTGYGKWHGIRPQSFVLRQKNNINWLDYAATHPCKGLVPAQVYISTDKNYGYLLYEIREIISSAEIPKDLRSIDPDQWSLGRVVGIEYRFPVLGVCCWLASEWESDPC